MHDWSCSNFCFGWKWSWCFGWCLGWCLRQDLGRHCYLRRFLGLCLGRRYYWGCHDSMFSRKCQLLARSKQQIQVVKSTDNMCFSALDTTIDVGKWRKINNCVIHSKIWWIISGRTKIHKFWILELLLFTSAGLWRPRLWAREAFRNCSKLSKN